MCDPRVSLAVCGRFHYGNYVRFLAVADVLNRFYYAGRLSLNGRSLGIPESKAVNGFIKEYAVYLHGRFLKGFWQVPAYALYHDLWQRYVLRRWAPADILHIMLHGNARLLMARARMEKSLVVGEPVNSHPDDLRNLLNEEYGRLGLKERLLPDKLEQRRADEALQCDYLLAGSEFVRDSFIRHGFPRERTEVIPYGVDLGNFSPLTEPERRSEVTELQGRKFRVICVAQIHPRKGHVYLLEAWKQLKLPDAELLFIGHIAPNMKPVLARYEGSFTHIPHVPHTSLRHYYARSDVFALASIEDGFGYVCAEAMGCGLPVVATENTGGSELLEEGVTGFKVPIRSPEAIAEEINLLYRDRQKLKAMSEAARSKAAAGMGWDIYAEKLCRFYKSVVGKSGSL